MGGAELTSDPPAASNDEKSLSELLDELCPYYMSMGVPYDLFWYGDYCQLKYYVRKHELELEQKNQELYLSGAYSFEAFISALANLHFDGKHHKPVSYIEKPFDIFKKKTEESKEKTEEEQYEENMKIVKQLKDWTESYMAKKRVINNDA